MSVNQKMTAIADEVRTLAGVADKLNLDDMAAHTHDANTEVGTQENLIEQIRTALQGKTAVGDADPVIEPLEITENGTYTAPDGVDGYSPVTVNVPIPDGYIKPSGTRNITENGTHDVTAYDSVAVSVPTGEDVTEETNEYTEKLEALEIAIAALETELEGKAGGEVVEPAIEPLTVTENGTYTAPDGVDGYSPVTVNVPIPDGYIKPSGTKNITENGTHDAKAYEAVNVNVPIPDGYIQPSGELEVTENGTHDVTAYASVNVNVEASGGDPKALLDAALNNTLTAIDSNVTSIVGYACRGLSKLKTVNLPNATSIGTYAFYYCTAMTSINAPKVKSLGNYAFYNCNVLKSVNFPLATSVGQNSFYSCSSLEKADFGVAGTINQAGFAYCDNLKALILRKSDAICKLETATNALKGSAIANGTGYVYVPAALIEEYKVATNWVNYASQFRAIEDYPEICGGEA